MKITIFGAGWLGENLANHLKNDFTIAATVNSQEKCDKLSQSFKTAYLPVEAVWENVATDVAIITFPPHVFDSLNIWHNLKKIEAQHIIYTSTISVFSETEGTVDENSTPKLPDNVTKNIYSIEQKLRELFKEKLTLLRLGGLLGGARHPIKHLAGRKNISNGNFPTNLIHRDDIVLIIEKMIKENCYPQILHLVCPSHETKKEFYIQAALNHNLPLPEYIESIEQNGRRVESILLPSFYPNWKYKSLINWTILKNF
jgi:nucleoside-diphosphate-sugar epimerase